MHHFSIQQIDRENKTAVLVGCIPFLDLLPKVRFSFRKEDEDGSEYQRRTDPNRAQKIARYIESTIMSSGDSLPVFPTSIIIAFDNESLDFREAKDDCMIESLPPDILIVDGQHRFEAMRLLYERTSIRQPSLFDDYENEKRISEYLAGYRFNCSVLLNYDLWDQARIFASVNFNQKKVNKSLFYDIYGIQAPEADGEAIPKQNEIYLAHNLVKYLNSSDKSPFKGFVKMLGTGKGYISQAFLVEQLLKHLSPRGIWSDVAEDIKGGGKRRLQNYAALELTSFLAAVRSNFKDYWPEKVEDGKAPSILCKTTGIGALMSFLKDLHNNMPTELLQKFKDNKNSIFDIAEIVVYFDKSIRPIAKYGERFFSLGVKGKFSGTGGSGLQTKLYQDILRKWQESN